jgi:hypothetical protein
MCSYELNKKDKMVDEMSWLLKAAMSISTHGGQNVSII